MTTETATDALLAALPAGEWAEVEAILDGDGMMASKFGGILARARSLRHGGCLAFLKFISLAGADAGSDTEMVTGDVRLARLETRLTAMQRLGNVIPLVRLLEIRRIERPAGLLIAMERITVLHDLLTGSTGGDVDLALRVLRNLDSTRQPSFIHFDICPKNVGVRPDGSLVFIDPESLFLVEGEVARVTVPAWKRFRAPHDLVIEVDGQLGPAGLPQSTARKKHDFELALIAAQCCIGAPFGGEILTFDDRALAEWINGDMAKRHSHLATFWKRELERTLDGRAIRPPAEIARDLQATGVGASQRAPAGAPSRRVEPMATTVVSSVDQPVGGQMTEFEQTWRDVLPTARALRAGTLRPHQVAAYRETLEGIVSRFSAQREPWFELLLVVVSYQKSRADAVRFIKRARIAIDDDADLRRMERIIDLWGLEQIDVTE